jgi:hypothetical protein
MVAKIVGKYAAGLAKKDTTGHTKTVVENEAVAKTIERLKKDQLEALSKSGTSAEKYYAKQELERRAANKETAKNLKARQAKGELTEKQVKNRMAANKQKLQSSDDMRDSIIKEYHRAMGPRDDEAFSKGGMPKKKPAAAKKPVAKKPAVKSSIKKGK